MEKILNKDNTEKRTPKSYKIEPSLYNAAIDILKEDGITISCWIRDQIADYVKRKEITNNG